MIITECLIIAETENWSIQSLFTEVITCPSLSPPTDGVITFTPGADNSNIGLGSVVTYSCNLGYVLVGQTTRECQSVFGGATAGWTGYAPVCQGRIV